MTTLRDTFWFLVLILLAAIAIIFGPLLTIWSLNTLFPALAIPYALDTWFAALVLFAGVNSLTLRKK